MSGRTPHATQHSLPVIRCGALLLQDQRQPGAQDRPLGQHCRERPPALPLRVSCSLKGLHRARSGQEGGAVAPACAQTAGRCAGTGRGRRPQPTCWQPTLQNRCSWQRGQGMTWRALSGARHWEQRRSLWDLLGMHTRGASSSRSEIPHPCPSGRILGCRGGRVLGSDGSGASPATWQGAFRAAGYGARSARPEMRGPLAAAAPPGPAEQPPPLPPLLLGGLHPAARWTPAADRPIPLRLPPAPLAMQPPPGSPAWKPRAPAAAQPVRPRGPRRGDPVAGATWPVGTAPCRTLGPMLRDGKRRQRDHGAGTPGEGSAACREPEATLQSSSAKPSSSSRALFGGRWCSRTAARSSGGEWPRPGASTPAPAVAARRRHRARLCSSRAPATRSDPPSRHSASV